MEYLCSIVIPVFNEASNIEKCFEVIQSQTYKNIESVFVNDGSTDDSKNILTQVAKKFPNIKIKIIDQKNQGAASARRNGIEHASGEFIAILDCDDELSENAIYDAMISFNEKIDIVLFNLKYKSKFNNDIKINNFIYYTNKVCFSGLDALKHSLESWGVHGLGIYRKKILISSYMDYETVNFKNYINNDEVITRLSFYHSNMIYLSNGIYFYNNNLESTTKRVNKNLYKKIFNSIILYKILVENKKMNINPAFIIVYAWEAGKYFFENRKVLGNPLDWKGAINDVSIFIWKEKLFKALSPKRKFQFLILVIFGCFI